MKKALKILGIIITLISYIISIFAIAFIIHWYPVIDRLYIRPCYYYPNAFKDCVEKSNN